MSDDNIDGLGTRRGGEITDYRPMYAVLAVLAVLCGLLRLLVWWLTGSFWID